MEDLSLQQVLQKFVENKATAEEVRWLLTHFNTASEDQLMKLIMTGFAIDRHDVPSDRADHHVLNRVYDRMQQDLGFTGEYPDHKRSGMKWKFAAASIILALSFGGYFLLHKRQPPQTAYFKNDIKPGHNQATLTLANGKKIVLTKGLSGQLAQQGNTSVAINNQNGIAYTAGNNTNTGAIYNKLSTAIGEQSPYPLILADGTKVWLDAGSSITFPVTFNGKYRSVNISGQAYFEVVHNHAHPFKVMVKDQIVEDIGTHFNISAYEDEKTVTTTLLEGAVKVSFPAAHSSLQQAGVLLKPGQQAIAKDNKLKVAQGDVKEAVAWKSGDFYFENDSIQTVMRQLSRWYNIEISYEGNIPTDGFNAQISRSKNISAILHILENTKGVHFKIEGRRVTVIK